MDEPHPQDRIQELEQALKSMESAHAAAIRELEDVARFLSHDLRAPLRGIDGYSKALAEDYGEQLNGMGLAYLQYISESGRLAAAVVEKLIHYIRVPRAVLEMQPVDLSGEALEAAERMQLVYKSRKVALRIAPHLTAEADPRLTHLLMETLLENAWKFTGKQPEAQIEVGRMDSNVPAEFFIRDNGAGFNMIYQANLFQPFQRLHSAHEFEGAGMGLAVAKRIIERHGGRIWGQGEVDQGATFFFTLEPDNSK